MNSGTRRMNILTHALCRAAPSFQRGFTLLELLIAGLVSVIAVSAMLILMGNTLGATTQSIEMTRLTQELRTGMQVMTRELRRANYHASFLSCYGNADCLTDLGYTAKIGQINLANGGSCYWFWYDRPQYCNTASCTQAELTALQTAVTGETVAAFRRTTNADGVGLLQMATTQTGTPNCGSDADWVDITDPNFMDVLTLVVTDTESVCENLSTGTDSQLVERIGVTMTARMAFDASVRGWLQAAPNVTRSVTDFIRVRNNVTSGVACP